jgi:hypothetical protein
MKNAVLLAPLFRRTDRPPGAQITPSGLVQRDTVPLRGGLNALPGCITFGIAHPLHLIETRYGVSNMAGVFKRLFALRGKSELARWHCVALA